MYTSLIIYMTILICGWPHETMASSSSREIVIESKDAQKKFIQHYKVDKLPKSAPNQHTIIPVDHLKLCKQDDGTPKWKYCYRLLKTNYWTNQNVKFNHKAFWNDKNMNCPVNKNILFYDLPFSHRALKSEHVYAPMIVCYGMFENGENLILWLIDGDDDNHVYGFIESGLQVKVWYYFPLSDVKQEEFDAIQKKIDAAQQSRI